MAENCEHDEAATKSESDPESAEDFSLNSLFTEYPSDQQASYEVKVDEEKQPDNKETSGKEDAKEPKPDLEPQAELLWALKQNKYHRFVELLKHPAVKVKFQYTKPQYSDYGSCIEIASRFSNRGRYVKALLEAGAKPNVHEILPEPIHYAAGKGNPDALQVLLQDNRTNVNVVDSKGRTPLHHAVSFSNQGRDNKYYECIEMLLKRHDLEINKPNNKGYTAVYEAANSRKEAVGLFLKYRYHDVDLDTLRPRGRSAREFILNKYPDLAPELPKIKLHKVTPDINTQLLLSLQNQQLDDFTEILQRIDNDGDSRVDPNFIYGRPYNATCLEIACREDECVVFVRELLKAGADPNIVNPGTKQIPLHLAAKLGNQKVISALLGDRRTDINIQNDDGKSVLHIIAECEGNENYLNNVMKCLNLILGKKKSTSGETAIQVNVRDNHDKMAIEIAVEKDNKEFVKIILQEAGQYINLGAIMRERHETLLNIIKRKFPDLEEIIPTGRSLSQAESVSDLFRLLYNRKYEQFLTAIRSTGEDETMDIDDGNYTLLQYATLHDLEDFVEELLNAGANPNKTTTFEKRPPIIIAMQRRNRELFKLFLDKGELDVNAVDAKGNTALHFASKNEDLDCVVDLIRHGANYRLRNVFNKPPLPADSVNCFLDKSLMTCNEPSQHDYELIFDYDFLLASEQNFESCPHQQQKDPEGKCVKHKTKMNFLLYVSESKEHRNVIKHPIISSFLEIKDFQYNILSNIYDFICLLFVLLLNYYIVANVGKADTESKFSPSVLDTIAKIVIWFYLAVLTIILICDLARSRINFFWVLPNLVNIFLIPCIVPLLLVNRIPPTLAVIVIFLSFFKLILMTCRRTSFSTNFEILKTVSLNYFLFLISYIELILAFAFSFYSILHGVAKEQQENNERLNKTDNHDYGFYMTPWLSIQKVFMMMMGEFEANELLPQIKDYTTCFWLLSLFVFAIAIVLMNLLTGLAVNDIQNIKKNAYEVSLASRVRLFYDLEEGGLFKSQKINMLFINLLSYFLRRYRNFPIFLSNGSFKKIHIYPNQGPKIAFDGRHKHNWEMDPNILRDAMQIISSREKKSDEFDIKEAFDKMKENQENIIERFSIIEKKLKIQ